MTELEAAPSVPAAAKTESWVSPYQLGLTRILVGALGLFYFGLFPLEVPLGDGGSNAWLELPRVLRGASRLLAFILCGLVLLGWWRKAVAALLVLVGGFLALYGRVDPSAFGLLAVALIAATLPGGDDPLAVPPLSGNRGASVSLPGLFIEGLWPWLTLPLTAALCLHDPWLSVPGTEVLGIGLLAGAAYIAIRGASGLFALGLLSAWGVGILVAAGPLALPLWLPVTLLVLNRTWLPPRTPSLLPDEPTSLDAPDPPIVFYDGVCGLCQTSIQLIVAEDRDARLMHAPLQGETAQRIFGVVPGEEFDSLKLHEAGITYERSTGALRIAGYLGGFWRVVSWLRVVPLPIRDGAYHFVASNRYAWFGKLDACRIPTPSERARFLD